MAEGPWSSANASAWSDRREHERFDTSGTVELHQKGERVGLGNLRNISAGGCAFVCVSDLPIGETFEFVFRDGGSANGSIVRRDGTNLYGVQFDCALSETGDPVLARVKAKARSAAKGKINRD